MSRAVDDFYALIVESLSDDQQRPVAWHQNRRFAKDDVRMFFPRGRYIVRARMKPVAEAGRELASRDDTEAQP